MKQYCFVWENGIIRKVLFDSVTYIEANWNYIKIYTTQSEAHIKTHIAIGKVEDLFPNEKFVRVHKSYIVNIDRIKEIDNDIISIDGTHKLLSISNLYRKNFFSKINYIKSKYLTKKDNNVGS